LSGKFLNNQLEVVGEGEIGGGGLGVGVMDGVGVIVPVGASPTTVKKPDK
jgi:hypothetical protein